MKTPNKMWSYVTGDKKLNNNNNIIIIITKKKGLNRVLRYTHRFNSYKSIPNPQRGDGDIQPPAEAAATGANFPMTLLPHYLVKGLERGV